MSTNLDSEMILPVVGERLVELSVLVLRDVVRITRPQRLRLVQLLLVSILLLDRLLLLLLRVVVLILVKVLNLWLVLVLGDNGHV